MIKMTAVAGLVALCVTLPALSAEEKKAPEMTPEQKAEMEAYQKAGTPGPEHKAMAEQAGSYEASVKSWHDPKGPPMEEKGTATRKMALDGRMLVEDFSGSMMGQPFTGQGTRGFDNVSGKHWSTWMDSMSTGLMVSEGTCDKKNACTYKGSWNDAVTKKPKSVRMTSKWTNAKTEVFEMFGEDKDGKEMKMMEITYKKK